MNNSFNQLFYCIDNNIRHLCSFEEDDYLSASQMFDDDDDDIMLAAAALPGTLLHIFYSLLVHCAD